jgi:hypothetical protein
MVGGILPGKFRGTSGRLSIPCRPFQHNIACIVDGAPLNTVVTNISDGVTACGWTTDWANYLTFLSCNYM